MNESAPALADESIDSIDVVSPRPRRRPIILFARIGLSLAMLYVLVKRMPHFSVDRLLPDWSRDTAIFLLLAIILTLAGIVLSTLRWRAVLNALGQDEKLGKLLSHNLAGLFVSNVLPTTIGGGVLRVSRPLKGHGGSPRALARGGLAGRAGG